MKSPALLASATLMFGLILLVNGCGQVGPLYLPRSPAFSGPAAINTPAPLTNSAPGDAQLPVPPSTITPSTVLPTAPR